MKYIEADTVFSELTNRYKFAKGEARKAYREALDIVTAAGEIEVVRCRECKYREIEQPGMIYCQNIVGGWVDENWFCAGGEKE